MKGPPAGVGTRGWAWLTGVVSCAVSPGKNSLIAVRRRKEPSRQMTGLFQIFIGAATKGAQPKATSVTEEGLGKEIPFLRKQEN